MARILITTAELERAGRLREAFEPDDQVELVTSLDEAERRIDALPREDVALLLTASPEDDDELDVLARLSRERRRLPVMAALEDEDGAGALQSSVQLDDTFSGPIDPDEVALVVRRLLERKKLQDEIGIVGRTDAIQEVIERVAQIAPVGSTVLITGESGTGKELVARGLHHLSPRRGKPFIAVNIAALSETLLESELFGHEKGAFTGASALRKGMFELANGGTIFLDEIAEMPPQTQTKLLRVLEQREFMRVGGTSSIRVDVRVITATNRDLRQAVALDEFRRDLYYRLNVLHIDMPPLRERRADIPLLVYEFIREFGIQHDRTFKGITSEAMGMLVDYDWPGNVRELRNLVESMVVLAPGSVIRPEDIPPEVKRGRGRALLPTRVPTASPEEESTVSAGRSPEMEFVFRTLVELKLDVEDIRREFEAYKRSHPELVRPKSEVITAGRIISRTLTDESPAEEVEETPDQAAPEGEARTQREETEADKVIAFEPGMTMQELERAAIVATLEAEGGNRRRASEKLGIGERTLYRKIKEYDIDA